MKQHVLHIGRDQFEVQTFRAGGKGGQKQNKTSSGVRIIHKESGARGESREHRSQFQNKKAAFTRLVESPRFRWWLARKHQEKVDGITLEERVDAMLAPEYLKVEIRDEGGGWVLEEGVLK